MNIVNKLTIRHLKLNKRRTLVTIFGVIISVAMITAVATISTSFLNLLQREEIASSGEWHVLYQNVNKKQIEAIKEDEATKTLILSRDVGYALLEGSQNGNKPYLFIKEYNTAGFQQFPIELSKGRLPQAANEVVISEEIAETAKVEYKVGDTLTLDIGNRIVEDGEGLNFGQNDSIAQEDGVLKEKLEISETKSYTIVGVVKRPVWEPTWAPGYTIIAYTDASLLGENDQVNASVVLNKVKRSLYSNAEKLAAANGIDVESVRYNSSLLRYYGVTNNDSLNNLLFSLTAIIMTVIMVGSISLIYNAFAISVSERSRHLGMLSSVGATRRQKRNSVFFEGIIIGLISIPLGIISGLVGIGITFWAINSVITGALGMTQSLTVTVTPESILIACGVSALTIFISTYVPARKASKISAIDAIRQTTDIKLTGKAVKTSRFVRKLFGIEAEIGLKNLKRNKRRYQATVFSLVISIVLFLAVSYFTDNLKKSVELSQDGVNYDIEVVSGSEELEDSFIQSIVSLDEVTEYNAMKVAELHSWVDEAGIADPLREMFEQSEDDRYRYVVIIHALQEQSLKSYASKVGANYEELIDPNQMKAIVVDVATYEDAEAEKYVETKAIYAGIGDRLDIHWMDWDNDKEHQLGQIEIATFTDQLPMGVFPAGLGMLNVFVSENVLDRLLTEEVVEGVYLNNKLALTSTDPMLTQREIEEMDTSTGYYIRNVYKYRQQDEQMIMLLSVFTYGFILLITAISVANIFNTISTSISLRKREFAMLKSVGMTPKGFNKMINYESIFYGIKSLLYGLPISIVVMYLIHRSLMNSFDYRFELPWISMLYVVIAVFVIVGSAMMYSSSKVKRENIIDAIKQESI